MMSCEPNEHHGGDEQTPRHGARLDEVAERLQRLAREAKEAELERRLRTQDPRKG
jgi:hypothetical protein